MKDAEFIELLNLYLDHEISAEDAERIEAEVQQNPARRRIYQDYCRLQKACTLLAKDYVEQAAATGAADDRKVVAFPSRRTWGLGAYASGLAAAAACVAVVVFVNRSGPVAPLSQPGNSVVVADPAPPASSAPVDVTVQSTPTVDATARTIAQTVTVPAHRAELRPVFNASALTLNKNAATATLVASDQASLDAQFDWMRDIQLAPIQAGAVDTLRFEPKADLKANSRPFGPGRTQSDVQNAAFQFQR